LFRIADYEMIVSYIDSHKAKQLKSNYQILTQKKFQIMTQEIHVGKLIDSFADYKGWSREDLERILGISTSNMYKKLKMSDIDTSFIKKVASAAGITMPEFFLFGLNELGTTYKVNEETVIYKPNPVSNTERVLRERVSGLEAENLALKEHIETLKRLIDSYDKR
jgi:transcriptional regulator with XRE-family HTH domain